jgi:hypothetical protein
MAFGINYDEFDRTPPQTEDSAERGLVERQKDCPDPVTYADLGQASALDHDNVGDIADEGPGHRG